MATRKRLQAIADAWEEDSVHSSMRTGSKSGMIPAPEFLRLECQLARQPLTDKETKRGRARLQRLAKKLDREWLLRVCRLRDMLGIGAAQETYARALYRQLHRELATRLPQPVAAVSGMGVHWNCLVEWEQRSCDVSCFETWERVLGTSERVRAASSLSYSKHHPPPSGENNRTGRSGWCGLRQP